MSDEVRINYEDLKDKVEGRLHLSVLLQKRVRELMTGAPPLVSLDKGDFIDIALEEIRQGKVSLAEGSPEEIDDMKIKERLQMARQIKQRKY
jgi:DNA-directed RNA polymerase subunit K/omega